MRANALADAAVELPALLLDALDAGDGLHAAVIHSADFRDPVHAGGMAPQPCLRGGLQGTPLNGAQAALGGLAVILQASHAFVKKKQETCAVCLLGVREMKRDKDQWLCVSTGACSVSG